MKPAKKLQIILLTLISIAFVTSSLAYSDADCYTIGMWKSEIPEDTLYEEFPNAWPDYPSSNESNYVSVDTDSEFGHHIAWRQGAIVPDTRGQYIYEAQAAAWYKILATNSSAPSVEYRYFAYDVTTGERTQSFSIQYQHQWASSYIGQLREWKYSSPMPIDYQLGPNEVLGFYTVFHTHGASNIYYEYEYHYSSTQTPSYVDIWYSSGSGNSRYYISTDCVGGSSQDLQLDFIAIEGPDSVMENSSARYSCRAYYTDGSDSLISDSCLVNWTTSCAEAEFDQDDCNLLLTSVVAEDIACQLSASYAEDSIEKSVDKSILVVNDTMTATEDTVFVGNGYYDFSHEHISDEALCVPIFINNHTQLGGGSLPFTYDCALEPDTVIVTGTRLDGTDLLTTTIDTVENTISIGFITDLMGSGFFLEPVTQETVDDPVALIFFYKSCEQQASCDSVFYSMDTATVGMISLTLSDVAGQVVDCNFESNSETVDVYIPGEANSDCSVDVSDAMFVYNWIFIAGAPAPYCMYASDANGDCDYNVADPVYLINYIFRDGPGPLHYCSANPAVAKPFLPAVELIVQSTYDGENTHIEFISSSQFDIHGVQLEIACDNPVQGLEVVNLTGDMNLIADSRSSNIYLGMIDFSGNGYIASGNNAFAEIYLEGEIDIAGLDAVVADINGRACPVEWVPAVKQLPERFTLEQNRPNPFNPTTEISYSLPEASGVRLDVFNIMGQKVATLVDKYQEAGIHNAVWNGRDDNGRQVASGIYFYRMNADDYTETKKMILMK